MTISAAFVRLDHPLYAQVVSVADLTRFREDHVAERRASAEVAKTHSFVVIGPKWLIVIS